jgi:hypothetical protein
MTSSLLDQLGLSGGSSAPPAAAGDPSQLPPSMPDPEPHLQPDGSGAPPDAGGSVDVGQDATPDAGQDTTDHAGTTEVDTLKSMLGLAHDYSGIPTVQPDEAHKMAKAVTIITDLLAGNQRSRDSITGANPALRKLPGASGA